jgi:hypothetical protein
MFDSLSGAINFDPAKTQSLADPYMEKIQSITWGNNADLELFLWNNKFSGKMESVFKIKPEDINYYIVSASVSSLSSNEVDNVIARTRRLNVQMQEQFRFSLRFRDNEMGSLRKFFTAIFAMQQHSYFDDIKTTVIIMRKIEDTTNPLFHTDSALITQISEVTLNHNENSITEFDVQFVSPSYGDNIIYDFGININKNVEI